MSTALPVYTQGYGTASVAQPIPVLVAPNSSTVGYKLGQILVVTPTNSAYILTSYTTTAGNVTANWTTLSTAAGDIDTITTDDLTVVTPTAGNVNLAGSGSTTTTGSGSTATVALTGLTNHAVLVGAGTATITKLAVGATGTILAGSTAADPAFTASPSVSGSLTAGTTITATLGNITATNGSFVASTLGTGILLNSSQASGVAASPVVVNGRSGRATFTSVSIAAAADLTLTLTNSSITASTTEVMLSMSGATTGSALSIKSKTASSGSLAIVVTNGTGATTTTADIQIDFLVLNA